MNSVRVFRTSVAKALLYVAVSSVFVWAGVLTVGDSPLMGWLCILFFGAFVLVELALLLRGSTSLSLDEEGVEVVGLFRRRRLLWRDIVSIRMGNTHGASMIVLNYRSGGSRRSQVLIGNIYRVSLKDLYTVLQEWHRRYGRTT